MDQNAQSITYMWIPEAEESWGPLHCTWSEDQQRGFGSGAVKASPCSQHQSYHHHVSKRQRERTRQMTPFQPIVTALGRRRDCCTVETRLACREPSFNTHLLPTGTNTDQVCMDDNQVLETGRCSSSTICIHYALTYFAAYSHLMTWRRMEARARESTFTDHFGPGPGLSAWNTSFCFLVRDEKQKLNGLIPCYVTLGHEAGKRRSWAFLTLQPTLFLPLCPVTPVSSVLQDGVASFLYASLSLSLISSKQKLIFTEIKTRENNMMNNVHKWIGKMRWELDFKNWGVRFISDKNSRSP